MIPSADLLHWLRELPSHRASHMLKEIAALLRKHAERSWDDRLSRAAADLKAAQESESPGPAAASVQGILVFFNSPASLREVHLSREAGHDIKPENEEAVNAQLGALTMQLLLSARQTLARLEWRRRGR